MKTKKKKFNQVTKIIQLFTLTTQEVATEKQVNYIVYLFSQSKLNIKFNKEKDAPRLTKHKASQLIDCLLKGVDFKFRDLDLQQALHPKKKVYIPMSVEEKKKIKVEWTPPKEKTFDKVPKVSYEEMQAKLHQLELD
jgi:hypothetical protein